MLKQIQFFVFTIFLVQSLWAGTSSILQQELNHWEKSVINFDFYRTVITTKNCHSSVQKFAGCLLSLEYLLNHALGYVKIQDGSAKKIIKNPGDVKVVFWTEGRKKYFDYKKTIFKTGSLELAEVVSKISVEKKDLNILYQAVAEFRVFYNEMYLLSLKDGSTVFENWVTYVDKNKKEILAPYLLSQALNEYLETGVDPHTRIVREKYFLKNIGNDSTAQSLGFEAAQTNLRSRTVLRITRVLPKSPAQERGLRFGDFITHINGVAIDSTNAEKLLSSLADANSTKLQLKVERGGEPLFDLELETAPVKSQNFESDVFDFNGKVIGYAKLEMFTHIEDSSGNLKDCVDMDITFQVFQQGVDGAILDLRGNPGGVTETAACIAGLFLGPNQIIALEKSIRPNYFPTEAMKFFLERENEMHKDKVIRTPPYVSKIYTKPLVILVNEKSASAAELLSAALKDHNIAFVFGNLTYGKGTAGANTFVSREKDIHVKPSEPMSLENVPENRVTIVGTYSHFYSPKGTSHHGSGLTVHYKVFREPQPAKDEMIEWREKDLHLFPLMAKKLNLPSAYRIDLMDQLQADVKCLEAAKLSDIYESLSYSEKAKDMQILAAITQMSCMDQQLAHKQITQ